MKLKSAILAVAGSILLWSATVMADSKPANPSALNPHAWEKLSVSLGAFVSNTNTGVRVGSGLGVDVDVEDVLGLETSDTVLRAEALWRFTPNRRHRLDASWFALRRAASRTIGEDFDIKDRHGNTITIRAGSQVDSHFDLDVIEAAYSYSFIQDDRLDLAAVGGLYVMPVRFGFKASGITDASGSLNFTAPLPVAGLRLDVALTPRLYLRTGSQIFAIDYQNFSGHLTQLRAAVELVPIKNVGVGIGVDSMRFAFEAKGEDYPNVDMRGTVEYEYTGIQLYGKLLFGRD